MKHLILLLCLLVLVGVSARPAMASGECCGYYIENIPVNCNNPEQPDCTTQQDAARCSWGGCNECMSPAGFGVCCGNEYQVDTIIYCLHWGRLQPPSPGTSMKSAAKEKLGWRLPSWVPVAYIPTCQGGFLQFRSTDEHSPKKKGGV
jgi:hypothetical protein